MTSYRLFGSALGLAAANDGVAISVGMEFTVSSTCWVTDMWTYQPASGTLALDPRRFAIYQVGGTTPLGQCARWPTAADTWYGAPLPEPVQLVAGTHYRVTAFHPNGQYPATANYWTTGPGASGLSSGLLSAPNSAGSTVGQGTYLYGGIPSNPTDTFNGGQYWVDLTVSDTNPNPVHAWVNHVTITMPQNGTTGHTFDPADTAHVSNGTAFTPTAGRYLIAVGAGGVTFTTATGWTLKDSKVTDTGLYVWDRTAAGGDTFATTHNGTDYPASMEFFEFPAGSAWGASVNGSVGNANPNPTLGTIPAGSWVCAVASLSSTSNIPSYCAWDAGSMRWASQGYVTPGGHAYGSTEITNYGSTSFAPTPWFWNLSGVTMSQITFRVTPASGGTTYTKSASDPVGITDAVSRIVTARRSPTDSVGITDQVSAILGARRTIADGVGITDGITKALQAVRQVWDQVGITDLDAPQQLFVRDTLTEQIGITDTQTLARAIPPADTAGITDQVTWVMTSPGKRTVSDPVGLTDTVTAAQLLRRTPTDPVGLSDSVVRILTARRTLADPVGISDTATGLIVQTGTTTVADTVGITDTVQAVITVIRRSIDLKPRHARALLRGDRGYPTRRIRQTVAGDYIPPIPAATKDELLMHFTIRSRQRTGYDDSGNPVYAWDDLLDDIALAWETRTEIRDGVTYVLGTLLIANRDDTPIPETAIAVNETGGDQWRILSVEDLPQASRIRMERIE